jgi:predicted transcriptional regulator
MKIIFFLIAFCLLFLRIYLSWTGYGKKDGNEGTMTISNGRDQEQINFSGIIKLNDEETGIQSISPGGYFKYRKNGEKMVAESNLHGEISYELFEGRNKLPIDERGKKFLSEAIKEMIAYGFDAEGRIERIYQKGGNRALLNEMDNMKTDNGKNMFLEHLFGADTLSQEERTLVAKKIRSLGSDQDKVKFLTRFEINNLNNPETAQAYFGVVESMRSDMDKKNIIDHLIEQGENTEEIFNGLLDLTGHLGSDMDKKNILDHLIDRQKITEPRIDSILNMIEHLGSDMDKENILMHLIEKGAITAGHSYKVFDITRNLGSDQGKEKILKRLIDLGIISEENFNKLLDIIERIGSDLEKKDLFKKLVEEKTMTEEQWLNIINQTAFLSSDFEKSNLLVLIAQKMPKSEKTKAAYMKVAKTIHADQDYGKALRAID